MPSTEGAGLFQLNDGCDVSFKAGNTDEDVEIDSENGSDLGAKTAVVGGWVAFASVFRGGRT